ATNLGAYYTPLVEPYATPAGTPISVGTAINLVQHPGYDDELRYGDTITLAAQLLDQHGTPLAGQRLYFGAGGQRRSAVTNELGVAQARVSMNGSIEEFYAFTVDFAGTETYLPSHIEYCCVFMDKQTTSLSL